VLVEVRTIISWTPAAWSTAVTECAPGDLPVQLTAAPAHVADPEEAAERSVARHRGRTQSGVGSKVYGPALPALSALAGTFSFYPAKYLGCVGDGAAATW